MCKCHGVSGSCSTKTCWQQLVDFRQVGAYLKRRYRHRAVKVDFHNGVLRRTKPGRQSHLPSVRRRDLVYLERSPDHCLVNNTAGTYATLGRRCSRPGSGATDRWEKRSCQTLCSSCGLTVTKHTALVDNKCDCKFHWCCEVQCQICKENVTILKCSL